LSDIGDDLEATSEAISADVERLQRVEARKRRLGPGDPELVKLSREAEAIARELVPKTIAEGELAAESTRET
jgi:hypothetical protein